jgi:hypothetical protein
MSRDVKVDRDVDGHVRGKSLQVMCNSVLERVAREDFYRVLF